MDLERYKFFVVAGSAFFAFSLAAFLFSFPPQSASAQGAVAVANSAAASKHLRPLEMHIANNGLVLLRSARVTAINGTLITVSASWGSADFVWLVRTDAKRVGTRDFGTRFLDSNGQKSSLWDVHVGSLVTITGVLDSTAGEPTIDADSFRNLE